MAVERKSAPIPRSMTAQVVGVTFGKGLVFAVLFGAWAFGYYLLALGACFECSVQAAATYGAGSLVLIPVLVLWLLNSSWGRLHLYLKRLRRPSLLRLIVTGLIWGLGFGLVVSALTSSAWRIAPVLAAWMVFWLVFPRVLTGFYGRELEIQ
jgi:hypothetical protein